jgi:hypothetical protein
MVAPTLASFPAHGRRETNEVIALCEAVIRQFVIYCTQLHFPSAAVAPAAAVLSTTTTVEVGDTDNKRVLFGESKVKRVRVNRTGGTAVGGELFDPANPTVGAQQVILSFVEGQTTIGIRATAAGTVTMSLTDIDSSGLTATDTVTCTFS